MPQCAALPKPVILLPPTLPIGSCARRASRFARRITARAPLSSVQKRWGSPSTSCRLPKCKRSNPRSRPRRCPPYRSMLRSGRVRASAVRRPIACANKSSIGGRNCRETSPCRRDRPCAHHCRVRYEEQSSETRRQSHAQERKGSIAAAQSYHAMNHFSYRSGRLFAEDVDLARLADEVGTPCYVYSTATLERHYRNFAAALPPSSLIAFSVKANGNLAVLKTLARLGAGADVVSGGELKKAMAAGIPPERIVFSGVGKTRAEMHAALEAGIHQFNVESAPELRALDAGARALGKRAPIALRINPDVDARTHAKITTGTAENKFGVPWSRARDTYRMAATLEGIRIEGVDLHIGSQITELGPFEVAFSRAIELIGVLRADGHAIRRADFGGGLGVP